jgi:transposase
LQLTSGTVHDSRQAILLLSEVPLKKACILGDRAYGSKEIRSYIVEQGGIYVIPPKKNACQQWKTDWYLYKERHVVECFFNKLKNFRRVATRYDKLAASFLAFIHIAAIALLVK